MNIMCERGKSTDDYDLICYLKDFGDLYITVVNMISRVIYVQFKTFTYPSLYSLRRFVKWFTTFTSGYVCIAASNTKKDYDEERWLKFVGFNKLHTVDNIEVYTFVNA